jgi:glucokinase
MKRNQVLKEIKKSAISKSKLKKVHMSTYYVAGDIGGTNARLVLVQVLPDSTEKEIATKHYSTQQSPSFDGVLAEFLKEFNSGNSPQALCLAVAGPVKDTKEGDRVARMTNKTSWVISRSQVSKHFQIPAVELINDFVAVGYGLTVMEEKDLVVMHDAPRRDGAPIACLGAGTGLGEVVLTHNGRYYDAWPTEGGHTDYPAKTETEFELLKYILKNENCSRVSVERVVCGSAIPSVYRFFKSRGMEEDPVIAQELNNPNADKAKIISKNGLREEKPDNICYETMMLFLNNYFAEAGNLALKTLPYGGLFIAGGIAPKILDALETRKEDLMGVYFAKGRMREIMREIPVYIVKNPSVGELGSKVVARRLLAEQNRGHTNNLALLSLNSPKKEHKTGTGAKNELKKYAIGFLVGLTTSFAAIGIALAITNRKEEDPFGDIEYVFGKNKF